MHTEDFYSVIMGVFVYLVAIQIFLLLLSFFFSFFFVSNYHYLQQLSALSYHRLDFLYDLTTVGPPHLLSISFLSIDIFSLLLFSYFLIRYLLRYQFNYKHAAYTHQYWETHILDSVNDGGEWWIKKHIYKKIRKRNLTIKDNINLGNARVYFYSWDSPIWKQNINIQ